MIVAEVNVRRMLQVIRQFPSTSNVTMEGFLKDQTRLLISSSGAVPGLVQVSPPFGNGAKGSQAKKQGEAAVAGDIYSVYATPGHVHELIRRHGGARLAAAWWKVWKTNPASARQWLAQNAPGFVKSLPVGWDDGTVHRAARGNDGRVRAGRPRMIVLNELGRLKRYVAKRKRNVGLVAASIPAAAGGRFGQLKGIPAWIARHESTWGFVREERKPNGKIITLGISKRGIRGLQRRFTSVLTYRMKALERQLPYLTRKLDRQLQELLNRA